MIAEPRFLIGSMKSLLQFRLADTEGLRQASGVRVETVHFQPIDGEVATPLG
jgi:hypothetical protein